MGVGEHPCPRDHPNRVGEHLDGVGGTHGPGISQVGLRSTWMELMSTHVGFGKHLDGAEEHPNGSWGAPMSQGSPK